MRVMVLAQFYPPVIGGEERHVRNLSLELAARGHDVHVACLDVGQPPVDDPGVTVHALSNLGVRVPALYPTADRPLALPIPDPFVTRALGRLVAELRPDVVHAHNWIINSYLPLPAARRLPLVYSLHDYSHVCPTKRLMYLDEGLCSGPTPRKCFTCTTDWYGAGRGPVIQAAVRTGRPVRNRVVDVFTPVSTYVGQANALDEQGVRWEVVPNFVPDALLSSRDVPRDPALPEGDYLFFAGDLSEQKGVGTVLAAYDRLDVASRPALLLVGREAMDLSDLPAGARAEQKWDHDRIVSGFAHARAAVLPSQWPDPCPTTVLEAMALGAPLVTTAMGGIADMVTDGDSALVVPPGDVDMTTRALSRLLDSPELGARLAASGSVEVRRYLQSTVAQRFEEIYASLV
ncbi:glycosyltransferase family 4 protein [Nocardioides flavescens]|uniref:Glycosyltransferase n=1 Tax=Nocardioides flavescens TaxID=2691959 RepID=A0A6L7ET14_9ACTN|nr:glycosyltransferase family 4 protein [Nocardioides flavescens]MXG88726.1 glycosyltransferase [Nocardioides flavescens]